MKNDRYIEVTMHTCTLECRISECESTVQDLVVKVSVPVAQWISALDFKGCGFESHLG